jgi:hypothetical protein
MSSRSNFSPGGAGSMKSNVNVNLNTAGGNKKQGITSRVTTDAWTNTSIKSDSNGMNRNIVFTQNQLGGVGVGRSMFKGVSNGADGSSNKGPYFYGGKDYLEFPKAQGFESFPYGLSASNGNNKIQVTTSGVLLTTGISSIMLNDTIDIIGNISCSGTIDVPGMNTTAVDASDVGAAMTVGSNLTTGSLVIGGTQTGNISLGAGQTSGILNIGTGARSASDINIGTGANASGNIYIGHKGTTLSTQQVKINTSTGLTVGKTTIGSSTSETDIGGALTVTQTVTANSFKLSGIPPTLTKSSLGYYLNYTKVSASYSADPKYLYSPTSNEATTDSNYLEAGVYMANIHMYAVTTGHTYSNTFQIGVAAGTNIQTMPVNSQYGTMVLTSGDLTSANAGATTTNNNYVFSHSGCFTLTSSRFVHLEFYLKNQSGVPAQTYNLYGCIYRIA